MTVEKQIEGERQQREFLSFAIGHRMEACLGNEEKGDTNHTIWTAMVLYAAHKLHFRATHGRIL